VVFRDQKPKPKPIGNPYCDLVSDDYRGTCHDRKDYDEETGLYPCKDGSDVKDYRDCPDGDDDLPNCNSVEYGTRCNGSEDEDSWLDGEQLNTTKAN
jgi:hypothetical protein